jgi:hypothetical protein
LHSSDYKQGKTLQNDRHLKGLELCWTVDVDFDFRSGNCAEEFYCEIWMSDDKEPRDNQTVNQMKSDGRRK